MLDLSDPALMLSALILAAQEFPAPAANSLPTFAQYGPLTGKGWLNQISPADRKDFGRYGYEAAAAKGVNINSIGGQARAKSGARDGRGRYIKQENKQ